MPTRDVTLANAAAPARVRRARAETAALEDFRDHFALEDGPDAVAIYLTALGQDGLSGHAIRERLERLDLDRRLRGLAPWHTDADIRVFLRGLHSSKPIGEGRGHYDPLYLDLVHGLVDACRAPTDVQRRGLAAHVVRAATGLSIAALARLRWRDVHIKKHYVTLSSMRKIGRGAETATVYTLHALHGDPLCPVAAFRALRPLGGGEFVFGIAGRPIDTARLRSLGKERASLLPTPAQVRDQALLLIGYGAGLRTYEATTLRQGDVQPQDQGLVLSITGRQRLTYLPSSPDGSYDPSTAWEVWLKRLDDRGLRRPEGLAFRATNFQVIFEKGLSAAGLNRMVHRRADKAGLSGRFVWTSLRTGMMRTAVRNNERPFTIAAHADLSSLGSVQRHELRENVLGVGAVARRLGL